MPGVVDDDESLIQALGDFSGSSSSYSVNEICKETRTDIDRMKEEICSHLQAEIRLGFANLTVKLIQEMHTTFDSVSKKGLDKDKTKIKDQQHLASKEFRSGHSGPEQKISPEIPARPDRHTCQERRPSMDSAITHVKSMRMQNWRKQVESDIDKLEGRVINQMGLIRDRSLKNAHLPDNCLYRFVHGRPFSAVSFLMIIVNAFWMSIESDSFVQQGGQQSVWQERVSQILALYFVVELVLKIVALQKYFICGKDWKWNILDFLLVLPIIPEFIWLNHNMNVNFLRLVRLAKVSRGFGLIRVVKFLVSLREILFSLFYTLGSLFWSFVALVLTSYLFAMLFMQWIIFRMQQGVEYGDVVTESFSSTARAMVCMFSMVSGGQEWYGLYLELDDSVARAALLFYIFFTLFGLMNVIMGVFVAKAMESSNTDEHLRIAKEDEKRVRKIEGLIKIFTEMDTQQEGCVHQHQFQAYFATHNAQCILQSCGVQIFDPYKLWEVLDSYDGERDGMVDMPGFIMGMLRLSGDAQSTELVMLSIRVQEIQNTLRQTQQIIDMQPGLKSRRIAPFESESASSYELDSGQRSPTVLGEAPCSLQL